MSSAVPRQKPISHLHHDHLHTLLLDFRMMQTAKLSLAPLRQPERQLGPIAFTFNPFTLGGITNPSFQNNRQVRLGFYYCVILIFHWPPGLRWWNTGYCKYSSFTSCYCFWKWVVGNWVVASTNSQIVQSGKTTACGLGFKKSLPAIHQQDFSCKSGWKSL